MRDDPRSADHQSRFASHVTSVAPYQSRFIRHALPVTLFLAALTPWPASGVDTVPELYMQRCALCHLPGIAGSPKVGDRDEWARRVRGGMSMVYRNAIDGIPNTAMSAKGGAAELKDEDVKAIVDYMIAAAKLSPHTLKAAARYEALNISNRDFIRLDSNFDGALSREEIAGDAALLQNFARFDMNRDGRLSVLEYENAEATLERERMAVRVDDASLVAAVRAAIAKVNGVDIDNTKVEAANGVVAMIGIVEEPLTATLAYDAVKRIPGIQKINNRLVSGHQMGWD